MSKRADPATAERILITGFEPYDDEINASQVLVESLRDDPPSSLLALSDRLRVEILPVDTERIASHIDELLTGYRPSLLLMTGQDASRGCLSLETCAANERRFSRPDNAGRLVSDRPVVGDGPRSLECTLGDPAGLAATLTAAGIDAQCSTDAGRYLCNQAYYIALHSAARLDAALRVGFVHLPLLPEQAERRDDARGTASLAETRRAIEVLLGELCRARGDAVL